MSRPSKLTHEFSGALRTFSYWVATGSVGHPLLEGIDYRSVMIEEPSLMEMAFAIFANVIEFNDQGEPLNAKFAEFRAAQHIRQYCQSEYVVVPPFEDWEMTLYGPPPRKDPQPWSFGVEP